MYSEQIRQRLPRRTNSVWDMKKTELVEVAMAELNMTLAQAEKETVTTWRGKIKMRRDSQKMALDPMMNLPKGLERIKKAELQEEMRKRGLPVPEHNPMNRAMMITQIRDQVAFLSETNQISQRRSQASSATTGKEWMTVDAAADRTIRRKQ